ncbi:hypothetical protein AX17_007396 [Amanita inopinata Kibby_2008]|nr:hypothetical protein AX17_007396 [Amanita inopinata Kibby_2008]
MNSSLWKGKARVIEQEFDPNDLNPQITYRHLLSNNLGVRDPLRVIALCDSDAFYAACEMVRLGTSPDIPLVVLQWDSLIAVNYPARKYGISRMDKVKEAKKRCPELVVVHVATYKEGEKEPGYWDNVDTNTHKVSLDYYRRESAKVGAMFRENLPECEIEKASIDEAFIDFTRPVRRLILERFPHIATVPPDAPHGIDTVLPPPPPVSWDDLGCVILIDPQPSTSSTANDGHETGKDSGDTQEVETGRHAVPLETAEQAKPDKVENQDTRLCGDEPTLTWHDVALSIAAELMGKARKDIHEKLGYTTSAGIARNKFLAKLSASYKKPNSQSILRNAAIPNYLRPMSFQKIRFLGGKLGEALAKEFEASTVGDMLWSAEEMQRKFEEESVWVYETLRGIDRAEVKEKSAVNKSMMASKNLPQAINQASEGYHWIRVLAAELALRLKDARQANPNLWPKTLVLHARKGYETGRSKQTPFPFAREVTVEAIASAGDKLWKELVGNSANVNVTNVQLAFTGIDASEAGQQSIESFLTSGQALKRSRDEGENNIDLALKEVNHAPTSARSSSPVLPSLSYKCPKCDKILTVFLDEDTINDGDPLESVRMEHNDFHYAQELSRNLTKGTSSSKRIRLGNAKRRNEPKGIEKFFTRK